AGNTADDMAPAAARDHAETSNAKAEEDVPEPDGDAGALADLGKEGAKALIDELTKDKAAEKEATKAEAATPAPAKEQGGDYYGRRAKGILKSEGGGAAKQHPLAAAHPGMDVVICDAGCNNAPSEIIYMQPSTKKVEVTTVGEMQQTAGTATPAGDATQIVCIGGCYDMPKVFSAAPSQAALIGDWTTGVSAGAPPPLRAGSGDWMRRIDATRGGQPARP
ncbi:MAG: hypothetical protein ACK4MF_05220, partial [Hyphomicrobiaceae bacterium]